jgi:hypothetical protein
VKATRQVIPIQMIEKQKLKAPNGQRLPSIQSRYRTQKDLLLYHPNFVPKPANARRELSPVACEASALTTELTARNHVYFNQKKTAL